jgi:hypothetical protein
VYFILDDTILIHCWVFGDDPRHVFPVRIEAHRTIGELKDVIKIKQDPQLRHVVAGTLTLRKISIPHAELVEKLREIHVEDGEELESMLELSEVFPNSPREHLHLIIHPPLASECLWLMWTMLC